MDRKLYGLIVLAPLLLAGCANRHFLAADSIPSPRELPGWRTAVIVSLDEKLRKDEAATGAVMIELIEVPGELSVVPTPDSALLLNPDGDRLTETMPLNGTFRQSAYVGPASLLARNQDFRWYGEFGILPEQLTCRVFYDVFVIGERSHQTVVIDYSLRYRKEFVFDWGV